MSKFHEPIIKVRASAADFVPNLRRGPEVIDHPVRVIEALRENLGRSFGDNVILISTGSNIVAPKREYVSRLVSDIDIVTISTYPDNGLRLDMQRLDKLTGVVRKTIEQLSRNDPPIQVVAFAQAVTETFVQDIARLHLSRRTGEHPESVNVIPLHALVYPNKRAFLTWEDDGSRTPLHLLSTGVSLLGDDSHRNEMIAEIELRLAKRHNGNGYSGNLNISRVITAERFIANSYIVLSANPEATLPFGTLWREGLGKLKAAAYATTEAQFSSNSHSRHIRSFGEVLDNLEGMSSGLRRFVEEIHDMRQRQTAPTKKELITLHHTGAAAVNETIIQIIQDKE